MTNQIELLRIFSAAAESASFRDAAVQLAVSPQVVTRAIRELEDRLGEPLFHRTTRSIKLTTFGSTFASRAKTVLKSVGDLFSSHPDGRDHASGIVRITAPSGLGRRYVAPILLDVMKKHPGIVVDLRLSDMLSSAVEEQIDIGVRAGFISDGRFVTRRVGPLPIYTVASPELIGSGGGPASIDELLHLPLSVLIDRTTGRPWPWIFRHNRQLVPNLPALITDDPEFEAFSATHGRVVSQCPEYLIRDELRRGKLVRLLTRDDASAWNLYVYRPQRGPVAGRVRVVFDALVKDLAITACHTDGQ